MRIAILISALALAAGAAGITIMGLCTPEFSAHAIQPKHLPRTNHEMLGMPARPTPGVRGVARYLTTDIAATGRNPIDDRDSH